MLGQELNEMLSLARAQERDVLRMRTWREDRAKGMMKPADSALADLMPFYMGGMLSESESQEAWEKMNEESH